MGGPQSLSGRCGEEKNLAMLEIEPRPSSPSYRLNLKTYCKAIQDFPLKTIPLECLTMPRQERRIGGIVNRNEKKYSTVSDAVPAILRPRLPFLSYDTDAYFTQSVI
jgi:hypothetical protein